MSYKHSVRLKAGLNIYKTLYHSELSDRSPIYNRAAASCLPEFCYLCIMRRIILGALGALLLFSCSGNHFLTDRQYRATVQQDYQTRASAWNGALAPFMALPDTLDRAEKEALTFLYAYMPLADVTDYPTQFHLDYVRAALAAKGCWDVPEREFRHFVLPLRVNNENLDGHRAVFQTELLPRIEGLGMQEAILEVNHWCHEKVTYQPSDARTASPLNLVKNALGRCGEESTFLVAALRSVGIPARQVYTPRWAHTDDNHAWVEAWADGRWWFLGACEPEPVLNLGWFNAPASRALLMHTRVFGKYDGPEEVVLEGANYTEINLIENYASTDMAYVFVFDALGNPVPDARIDYCIYNYAEFYPAVTKYTDAVGKTFLSAGQGDMLLWASKDGKFGYSRCSFGKDREVAIVLRYTGADAPAQNFLMVPPPEKVTLPEVTPEQRAQNDARLAQEDSLRHAYEATFRTDNPVLLRARGNWETFENFVGDCDTLRRADVLNSLSTKDFHDIAPEILQDYYNASVFLGARVENEFLTPFYGFFADKLDGIDSPEALLQWVRDSLSTPDEPHAWNIPMSPAGVYESRLALPRSRDIFYVSAARAKGIPARMDPVTGKIQVASGADWATVSFTGEAATVAPKGQLQLRYVPGKEVPNPQYYSHFTLSRIEDGRPRLLTFDEGEVDMGGGMDWAHAFRSGVSLDAGNYMLVSGKRLQDGSVPVSVCFFSLPADGTTVVDLVLNENLAPLPVAGQFDSQSIRDLTGDDAFIVALLEPGKEPTNHFLRDLAAAKGQLEDWGKPIVLLCSSEAELTRVLQEDSEGRYGSLPTTAIYGVAPDTMLTGAWPEEALLVGPRPVVILAHATGDVYFRSEGYNIGLGKQLAELSARL